MAKVGIVMGSDSDMPVMKKAADVLSKLGIEFEMNIISAHREPDTFFEYAKTAEERGLKVIIAGAGMAAHLPGMCAAIFPPFWLPKYWPFRTMSFLRNSRHTPRNLKTRWRRKTPDCRK